MASNVAQKLIQSHLVSGEIGTVNMLVCRSQLTG